MNNDLINRGDALAVAQYSEDKVEGIKNLPAADAVEVVRCKDCQYYQSSDWFEDGELVCKCWVDWIPTGENDFCSCGERRMDGE